MNSKGTSLKGGHHSKVDISDWLVLPYIHIIIVCNYTLYKADTSLRQSARAGPEGVWLRQNSLHILARFVTAETSCCCDIPMVLKRIYSNYWN